MPDPTDETSDGTSGLVDDLAAVLEDTGVHVEELIEELLEAVDLAETIAAALQACEGGEVDADAAARAQAARATPAGVRPGLPAVCETHSTRGARASGVDRTALEQLQRTVELAAVALEAAETVEVAETT
ncbi:hypothetical protein ACFX43_04370 [Nocardioides sp. YIM B13467]|uniref:hypothetical protein n=1 Tax=Nocardioides sp. YIM B13467 TaxID=3366294 RepID=UPI0036719BC3